MRLGDVVKGLALGAWYWIGVGRYCNWTCRPKCLDRQEKSRKGD